MPRVTNQDLADSIAALSKRLDAIELEAKVAKWLIRLLGGVFVSIIGYIAAHWKGNK